MKSQRAFCQELGITLRTFELIRWILIGLGLFGHIWSLLLGQGAKSGFVVFKATLFSIGLGALAEILKQFSELKFQRFKMA